jgi:hypothetical protein
VLAENDFSHTAHTIAVHCVRIRLRRQVARIAGAVRAERSRAHEAGRAYEFDLAYGSTEVPVCGHTVGALDSYF